MVAMELLIVIHQKRVIPTPKVDIFSQDAFPYNFVLAVEPFEVWLKEAGLLLDRIAVIAFEAIVHLNESLSKLEIDDP